MKIANKACNHCTSFEQELSSSKPHNFLVQVDAVDEGNVVAIHYLCLFCHAGWRRYMRSGDSKWAKVEAINLDLLPLPVTVRGGAASHGR